MATETEDWKRKYKDLSHEFEQSERYAERMIEQLRQLINSMITGLQGQDKLLDENLQILAKYLGDGEVRELRSVGREVEKRVRELDQKKNAVSREVADALSLWLSQIQRQSGDKISEEKLGDAREQIPEASEKFYALSKLIRQMLALQSGLHDNPPSADADTHDLDNEKDERQALLIPVISDKILELIECLRIPRERMESAQELIRRLENRPDMSELPDLLNEVVGLIRIAGLNVHDDFEDYLLSLNKQLSHVQAFLAQSREEESKAGALHLELDRTVRHNISKIRSTVKESTDLTDLKQAVTRQLATVVKNMNSYRVHEEHRDQRLQKRYDELLEKVEAMEREAEDVKARIEEEQLKARTDPLTGLPNRVSYNDHIASELERWRRYNTTFSMCVADLDHFKNINDQYGHLAGDKVLRLVAKMMRHNLRGSDFISRFGGEEFVVIFPSTGLQEARQATEKLRQAIEKSPFNFQGKPVHVTMSFGLTEVAQGDDQDNVFGRADAMLYKAKGGGRNAICFE
ncbi:diguanylate cyclase [Nitrincola sp. MINF-07-Sa-05]|uniref:diguanylate cyclase n=1 Tax=Nitrincola salilacus TaxID=3400273 RepID=UPI003917D758